MFRINFLAAIIFCFVSTSVASDKKKQPIVIAWWNVENLFDTTNDVDPLPQFGTDDEFTPTGARQWTQERFSKKLENLAQVIRSMNGGKGPDVLGVCEVERENNLRELIAIHLSDLGYEIAYHESGDARGIDVAFIYKKHVLKLKSFSYKVVPLPETEPPTRDIVFAQFEGIFGNFYAIGNHWPSKRGGAEASAWRRNLAAETCRSIVDSLLRQDPSADIIVMGDLNDTPTDLSVTSHLKASDNLEDVRGEKGGVFLYNTMSRFSGDSTAGTYFYRGKWEVIDHFVISRGLFDTKAISFASVEIFAPSFLRETSGRFAGAPRPTFGGNQYLGGYSDHFPVILTVVPHHPLPGHIRK